MADVNTIPRICCDNCGFTVEKTEESSYPGATVAPNGRKYRKPSDWGALKIEVSRSVDSYGGKARLDLGDLCPNCATAALDAAAAALRTRRGEDEAHG